ncbi:MAG: hypothetical protein L3J82_09800, partial [Planctomycetes bacterium]|nr:hypothetical protein [Planctomycetota bacterium]
VASTDKTETAPNIEIRSDSVEDKPQAQAALTTDEILSQHFTIEQRKMFSESFHNGREREREAKNHKKELQEGYEYRKWRLREWYTELFKQKPDNPINSLKDVDGSTLGKITSSNGRKIGILIGELEPVSDWLSWFENIDEYNGSVGTVAISLLEGIMLERCKFSRGHGLSQTESKRVLAVLDSFLAAWRGHAVSVGARCSLTNSLQAMCPVPGGLELIRYWTVTNPLGNETSESELIETLQYWPIKQSGYIAVEALALARAGAIKGVTDSWLAAKREYSDCKWTADEVKKLLALPLGQAVKETSGVSGILYAQLFAGDDLLADQVLEIGNALLARRDSAGASAYGFIFIRRDNIALSDSLWTEWFNSSDEYKIKAACTAANLGMGAVCRTDTVLDRMYNLAVNIENSGGIRSAAAWPLSILDKSGRALDLLEVWLNEGETRSAILIAIGRIVVRATEAEVIILLKRAIDEDSNTPAQRHYPLFLLATVAPEEALTYCENDLPFVSKFERLSLLLCAATAQAQLTTRDDNSDERVEEIYGQLSLPEPDWIRAIRLNLDYVKGHKAEQRVAGYPASRPK